MFGWFSVSKSESSPIEEVKEEVKEECTKIEENTGEYTEDDLRNLIFVGIRATRANSVTDSESSSDSETDHVDHVFSKELCKELCREIRSFDKGDLEPTETKTYYFYTVLDKIKKGVYLRHVQPKETEPFINKLKYTLEVMIVNERIRICGQDRLPYTDKEYANAFKKLLKYEVTSRIRSTVKIGCNLFMISTLGFIVTSVSESSNSFWLGVFLTNIILSGSFILNSR
jgi:hypothetical protein